jgi:hypothetical protein
VRSPSLAHCFRRLAVYQNEEQKAAYRASREKYIAARRAFGLTTEVEDRWVDDPKEAIKVRTACCADHRPVRMQVADPSHPPITCLRPDVAHQGRCWLPAPTGGFRPSAQARDTTPPKGACVDLVALQALLVDTGQALEAEPERRGLGRRLPCEGDDPCKASHPLHQCPYQARFPGGLALCRPVATPFSSLSPCLRPGC